MIGKTMVTTKEFNPFDMDGRTTEGGWTKAQEISRPFEHVDGSCAGYHSTARHDNQTKNNE